MGTVVSYFSTGQWGFQDLFFSHETAAAQEAWSQLGAERPPVQSAASCTTKFIFLLDPWDAYSSEGTFLSREVNAMNSGLLQLTKKRIKFRSTISWPLLGYVYHCHESI